MPGGGAAPVSDGQRALCRPTEDIVFDAGMDGGERVSVCSAALGRNGRIILRYGRPDRLLCERTNDRGDGELVLRRYTRPRVTYLSLEAACGTFDLKVSEAYESEDRTTWLTELFIDDGTSEDNGHGVPLLPTTAPLSLIAIEADVVALPFDG